MHIFWEGLCSYHSTDTFVHCRLNERLTKLHCNGKSAPEHHCQWELKSQKMWVVKLPQSVLWSTRCPRLQIWQCSPMPVKKDPWKLPVSKASCFGMLTLDVSDSYNLCISKANMLCKTSGSFRNHVQNYKEAMKKSSSPSSCTFLSFSKTMYSCSY